MLKREITFIVTMVNRMLQARSLHGHIMEKQNNNVKRAGNVPMLLQVNI